MASYMKRLKTTMHTDGYVSSPKAGGVSKDNKSRLTGADNLRH
jgi:hypothetical protein